MEKWGYGDMCGGNQLKEAYYIMRAVHPQNRQFHD